MITDNESPIIGEPSFIYKIIITSKTPYWLAQITFVQKVKATMS